MNKDLGPTEQFPNKQGREEAIQHQVKIKQKTIVLFSPGEEMNSLSKLNKHAVYFPYTYVHSTQTGMVSS